MKNQPESRFEPSGNPTIDSELPFDVNNHIKKAFTNISDVEYQKDEVDHLKQHLRNDLEDFAIYVNDTDMLQ